MTGFIEKLVQICHEEGVSEDFIQKIKACWNETRQQLIRDIDVLFSSIINAEAPRACLKCGTYTILSGNGFCPSCLDELKRQT